MNKTLIKLKAYALIIKCRIYEKLYKKPTVLTETETIDYIVENRCSIGRLGDGELDIMLGVNWKDTFQKYDKCLSHKLRRLKTDEKFLLCIPDVMMQERFNENIIVKKEFDFWRINLHQFLGGWCKYAAKSSILGNSFISRFYIRYVDKSKVHEYVERLKKIWEKETLYSLRVNKAA